MELSPGHKVTKKYMFMLFFVSLCLCERSLYVFFALRRAAENAEKTELSPSHKVTNKYMVMIFFVALCLCEKSLFV